MMVSQFAISEINQLEAEGFHPSPADIIRLNALGLKVEAAKKKNSNTALDYLPRVAKISQTVAFRQPTIGHEVWLDRVDQLFNARDFQSVLAVRAFALSRDVSELPNPMKEDVVASAIKSYAETLSAYTTDQIYAAVEYVMFGSSPIAGESPAKRDADDADDEAVNIYDGEGWKECVAAGILNEGKIALWGMSVAEMERMTHEQLIAAIKRAYIFHNLSSPDEVREREGEFYATLDEIRERLAKERSEANGKQ